MARWSAEKRAEVRTLIVDAAKDEFERVGFVDATMRDIATKSGIAVGTLFNYFPDKLALLETALFEDLSAIASGPLPDTDSVASLAELLVGAAEGFIRYYAERPALSQELLRATMFGERESPFRTQVEAFAGRLVGSVAALQERGLVRSDASAQAIVLAFFGHYYFVLISELGRSTPEQMLERIHLLVTQLERGVSS